MNTLLKTRRYT